MGKTNKQLRKLWPESLMMGWIDNVLFIDPGLGGTGWAYFSSLKLDANVPALPDDYGVLRASEGTWTERSAQIANMFREDEKLDVAVDHLFIEFPVVWSNSHKSLTSTQKGELFKLSYLCGQISITSFLESEVILFSPNDWKGQLPKAAVISRIKKQWPSLGKIQNHEADAIGMGLAFQGGL